jgi:hypothetical protein
MYSSLKSPSLPCILSKSRAGERLLSLRNVSSQHEIRSPRKRSVIIFNFFKGIIFKRLSAVTPSNLL